MRSHRTRRAIGGLQVVHFCHYRSGCSRCAMPQSWSTANLRTMVLGGNLIAVGNARRTRVPARPQSRRDSSSWHPSQRAVARM
eukprot:scaffold74487_cov30-Tisochrysis_lutea.AAC.2